MQVTVNDNLRRGSIVEQKERFDKSTHPHFHWSETKDLPIGHCASRLDSEHQLDHDFRKDRTQESSSFPQSLRATE